MTSPSCLIILNGEIPDAGPVRRAAGFCRVVICGDGGLRHALRLKLKPDFIAGDMDSLPKPLPRLAKAVYSCDFDENRSDFEKCLDLARDLGCRGAYVAGALGGRTDHALVNLALIERGVRGLEIILLDRGEARLLGPGLYRFQLARGGIFSLLAAPRAKVSVPNAKYRLRKTVLERGSRGLSNEARGPLSLTVHEGRLWFMTEQGGYEQVDRARGPQRSLKR